MLTTRKHLTLIVPNVLLLALMLVNGIGCKEKGQNQDTQEQATVERTESAVPAARDELMDSRVKSSFESCARQAGTNAGPPISPRSCAGIS